MILDRCYHGQGGVQMYFMQSTVIFSNNEIRPVGMLNLSDMRHWGTILSFAKLSKSVFSPTPEKFILAFRSAPVRSICTTVPNPNLGCSTCIPSCKVLVSLGLKSTGGLYVAAAGFATGVEEIPLLMPFTRFFAY